MFNSAALPDIMSGSPWIDLNFKIDGPQINPSVSTSLAPACPQINLFNFEAFKLSGLGCKEIRTSKLSAEDVKIFREAKKKNRKADRSTERAVIFLKIDSPLREELLHKDISLFPKTGILPAQLSNLLSKIGIGEERFVRVLNLSASGRYTSEQNNFHSFCIPEHSIVNQELDRLQASSENQAARIFKTHLIGVIYNRDFTLVIHDGESPTVNQLASNLADGHLEYFKAADRTPCVTTLLKDVIEANSISVQRVLGTFLQFKALPFRAHDTTIVAAFKMVLAELQNYIVTQEDPISSMEKLLKGIQKDSEGLHSLLNKPSRFQELLEGIQLTTQKSLQLHRALILREEARNAGVQSRSQYIQATMAALGAAVLPNYVITQLLLGGGVLQWAAHGIATLASLGLLIRMHKLGWFDFVTENFGDLFGLGKLKRLLHPKDKQAGTKVNLAVPANHPQ